MNVTIEIQINQRREYVGIQATYGEKQSFFIGDYHTNLTDLAKWSRELGAGGIEIDGIDFGTFIRKSRIRQGYDDLRIRSKVGFVYGEIGVKGWGVMESSVMIPLRWVYTIEMILDIKLFKELGVVVI